MIRKAATALLYVLYIFACLEGLAAAYTLLGFSVSNHRPDYARDSRVLTYSEWMTEADDWGAWHVPDAEARHVRCFSATYRSNSAGARDAEHTRSGNGKPRVLVLGDSFMEGWGVNHGERVTDILGRATGMEFLNFGASGNFGPLQYEILYRELARHFEHDAVLIGLLADNDFRDNELERWRRSGRYRPLYGPQGVTYLVERPPPGRTFAELQPLGWLQPWWRRLWLYGVILDMKYVLDAQINQRDQRKPYVGYRDPAPHEIAHVEGSIRNIRRLAEGRPVFLALIPRVNDLVWIAAQSQVPLSEELRAFAAREEIRFLDLAPVLLAEQPDYLPLFLACDGHWSVAGNQEVARILQREWFGKPLQYARP